MIHCLGRCVLPGIRAIKNHLFWDYVSCSLESRI